MDKIDEVKLTVVEAKAPTLEDVDTSTFVVKPHSTFKWALYSGTAFRALLRGWLAEREP